MGCISALTLIAPGAEGSQSMVVASDYAEWNADSEVAVIEEAGHFPRYRLADDPAPVHEGFPGVRRL